MPLTTVPVIRDGRIAFANQATADLFGARDGAALAGREIDELLPASQRTVTRDLARRLAKTGRLEMFELECTRLDGVGCIIEASVSITRFAGRHALQALLRDGTARRMQHTLLDRTRGLLELMADGAPLRPVLRRLCEFTEDMPGGSARCAIRLLDPERGRLLDETEAAAIEVLRRRGLRLLLDDFGTGYSSLSYLQRFPLDGLKIDRSFVSRAPQARDARAVIEAVPSLSRSLELTSIAEGVETQEQADWLRQAGCAELQGFLYARPLPAGDMIALLRGPGVGLKARAASQR
jgi:PAS domain S-box-containing protein